MAKTQDKPQEGEKLDKPADGENLATAGSQTTQGEQGGADDRRIAELQKRLDDLEAAAKARDQAELDRLREQNDQLQRQLGQLASQPLRSASPIDPLREADLRMAAKMDAHYQQLEARKAELESGPLPFEVKLQGNPTLRVGARDSTHAIAKYKDFLGIRSSEHQFEASQLEEPALA